METSREKEIKIGDKIVCVMHSSYLSGKTGTVVRIFTWKTDLYASVEFDEHINGHDCGGLTKEGHGLNISIKYLKLLNKILTVKQWKQINTKTN